MKKKIEDIQTKLDNVVKAMDTVKEQIRVYDLKGEELAMEATYLKGKLDMLKELEGEENVWYKERATLWC